MKDAVIILCGGGPAPGMNSVSMSVAKTFITKGFRVIGLHGGYSGLFSKNARTEDLTFAIADRYFNRGGSYLEMSRFKPTDADFENNFNLDLFKTTTSSSSLPSVVMTLPLLQIVSQSSSQPRDILSQTSTVLRQSTTTSLFLQTLLLSDTTLQRTRVRTLHVQCMRMPALQETGS